MISLAESKMNLKKEKIHENIIAAENMPPNCNNKRLEIGSVVLEATISFCKFKV